MSTRNARFQQWQALLTNRRKRQQAGALLVQGVRPITMAVRHGWPVRELLCRHGELSRWASQLREQFAAEAVTVSDPLLRELGEKAEAPPELIAVVAMPDARVRDELSRIAVTPAMVVLALDRPASPGNLGTAIRSADAFGAAGVIITGHAADPYDPQSVRASTGSLFAVPAVRVPGPGPVLEWLSALAARGVELQVVTADEDGARDVAEVDLTGATLLAVGNETTGLSSAWRDAGQVSARVPIAGSASSLNAATAASILLYETSRQRRWPHRTIMDSTPG